MSANSDSSSQIRNDIRDILKDLGNTRRRSPRVPPVDVHCSPLQFFPSYGLFPVRTATAALHSLVHLLQTNLLKLTFLFCGF